MTSYIIWVVLDHFSFLVDHASHLSSGDQSLRLGHLSHRMKQEKDPPGSGFSHALENRSKFFVWHCFSCLYSNITPKLSRRETA
jgi:hypothetical protein